MGAVVYRQLDEIETVKLCRPRPTISAIFSTAVGGEQWEGGLALKLHGARRLTIEAWPALKDAKGSVILMSGNSALFPQAPHAAVGTINAAIVALAKAFSDRGIADGVQVNSVLPGPVMTGRRRSYLEHWASIHGISVDEAAEKFPRDAGIARYGEPQEIAERTAFMMSPGARG
jgi:3-oxoacyl-[acyl-carrier protein] reductase